MMLQKKRLLPFLITAGVIAVLGLLILPLLARPSNCGGNSAALFACKNFLLSARVEAIDNNSRFSFDKLDLENRSFLTNLVQPHWIPDASFLIKTNFVISESNRQIVIICNQSYGNIPQPSIWNLYHQNPAHAVGYSDGSTGLIKPSDYVGLDLHEFVPLALALTNNIPSIVPR